MLYNIYLLNNKKKLKNNKNKLIIKNFYPMKFKIKLIIYN